MARGSDSDPSPLTDKLDDHSTPGERLARTRRPLNGKHRSLACEGTNESFCARRQLTILSDQGSLKFPQRSGALSKQKLPRRLKLPRPGDPMFCHMRRKAKQAVAQDCGTHDVEGYEGGRMRNLRSRAALEINRPIVVVKGDHRPCAVPCSRIVDFVRTVNRMVLGWESVSVDCRTLDVIDLCDIRKPAQGVPVL